MSELSRRAFMKVTATQVAAASLLSPTAFELHANPLGLPIGCQTWPEDGQRQGDHHQPSGQRQTCRRGATEAAGERGPGDPAGALRRQQIAIAAGTESKSPGDEEQQDRLSAIDEAGGGVCADHPPRFGRRPQTWAPCRSSRRSPRTPLTAESVAGSPHPAAAPGRTRGRRGSRR